MPAPYLLHARLTVLYYSIRFMLCTIACLFNVLEIEQ